jgi:hypothetical protein
MPLFTGFIRIFRRGIEAYFLLRSNFVRKIKMKLRFTASEAAFYLTRFYDALYKKSGTVIGKNGTLQYTSVPVMVGRDANGNDVTLTCAPLFSEFENLAIMGHLQEYLTYFGLTGNGYILFRLNNESPSLNVPFQMTFDFNQDLKNYIETLRALDEIKLNPQKMIVKINGLEYRS